VLLDLARDQTSKSFLVLFFKKEHAFFMTSLLRRPFWFLRHGETDWNRENRTQGSTDVPLNETGLAQAAAAAEQLRGRDITAVFCSPLQRAHRTAMIVGDMLGLPVTVQEGLREAGFGAHEGEVMGAWFAAWTEGAVAPERGESFADVQARAVAAINGVLATPGPVLIVAHGSLFRTVRAAMGLSPAVRTPNAVPLLCVPDEQAWRLDAA
jgi:probable phosphoglycerate mutase